ncbi:MAG: nucleotidyl transferase AbiEii/AbiGii toxin family protein [Simkania sp.]|nr:nucleotidyl transferase AbiEii/AbiGii toxin family protein [Simkania sp.]
MNIIPLRNRLDRERKKSSLTFETIQQDYLLSWILFGLYEHPSLKGNLIFKGGTALKKCYFGNYRFSEDLDFSVVASIPRKDKLLAAVIEACKVAEQKMNEFAEIRLIIERYEEKDDHPFEQEAFKVRAQFPWQREPLISAKIEITMQETVLFPPVMKQIIHPYDEKIDTLIQTYSLEEVVLEKLRAILQKTKKLHEEGRDRSRTRDYYDLWRIFTAFESALHFDNFSMLLQKKCDLKNVQFVGIESFFDPVMMETVKRTWRQWLGNLVSDLPECSLVINELKTKLEALLANKQVDFLSVIFAMNQNKLRGTPLFNTLKTIIENGGNVNQKTSNGHHFLQLLIKANLEHRQKLELVKLSVDRGANISSSDTSTLSPFATAVSIGDKEIADFLRSKGASPKEVPLSLGTHYYNLYHQFPV